MLSLSMHRRSVVKWASVVVAVMLLVACGPRVYYPVTVADVKLSPVYRLNVVNQSSQKLSFVPTRKFRAHYEPTVVAAGEAISCLVQVSRIKVGQTFTHEVVAGPYIDSGRLGPDRADIQYRDSQDIKHDIVIDIGHPSWFDPYTVSGHGDRPEPKVITIGLTDETLSKHKWFAKGPDAP